MGVAIIGLITSIWSSMMSGRKNEEALEDQRQYAASTSYLSAVRSVQLQREQRQLVARIATEQKEYSEGVQDLQTQLFSALENAELVKGSGPTMKPLPVEKILLPVLIAFALKVVLK